MTDNLSFETIKKYFSAEDYEATQVGERPVLNLKFEERFDRNRIEKWSGQIIVEDDGSLRKIVLFSFVPFKISEDKQELVAELLNRINYAEDVGNFEMNYNTGQVRCRTSIEIISDNITSKIIYGIDTNNSDLMGKYLPIIDQVNQGELLPMDAIDDDDYDNYI